MHFSKELPPQILKYWGLRGLWLCGCVSLIMLAGCASPSRNPAASPGRIQSRAAYVCSFGEFVRWPDGVFADKQAPFIIGIYGADTMDGKLQGTAKDQRINGREVMVRTIRTDEEMGRCQILFISGVKRSGPHGSLGRFSEAELAGIATRLSRTPVLTVSENMRHFSDSGIMINLSEGVEKTHFEINVPAANRAGLKISAKLQALAWGRVK